MEIGVDNFKIPNLRLYRNIETIQKSEPNFNIFLSEEPKWQITARFKIPKARGYINVCGPYVNLRRCILFLLPIILDIISMPGQIIQAILYYLLIRMRKKEFVLSEFMCDKFVHRTNFLRCNSSRYPDII